MIEFRNEGWCRWNGHLMSPENFEKVFGIPQDLEPVIEEDYIECGEIIYTDLTFGELFGNIVTSRGHHRGKEPEYDAVLSQGHGFGRHSAATEVECSYIIPETVVDWYSKTKVKPMKQFKKDYPKFKQNKYLAYSDELDAYYQKEFGR